MNEQRPKQKIVVDLTGCRPCPPFRPRMEGENLVDYDNARIKAAQEFFRADHQRRDEERLQAGQ